jgi:hypothetical protein
MARKSDDPDRIYRMLDLVGCSIRQQQEEGTDSPPARRAADVIFATIKTTAAGRGMNAEEIHALGGNPFSNHLAEEFVGLERLRTITEQHFPEGVGGREERAVADELGSLPQLGPFREIVHAVMRVLLHCGNTTAPAQDLTAEPNEAPDAPALSVM